MIASLTGTLRRKGTDYLIVDVAGVGYQVFVPFSTSSGIPNEGEDLSLHIHTHLREDSLMLFGFLTEAEREMFLLLLGVSGIGPKLALAVLSSLSVKDLAHALQVSDDSKLCAIPGIGKKTAARMVLELKDKIKHSIASAFPQESVPVISGVGEDAVSALINLGYKKQLAEDALKKVQTSQPGLSLEELIRQTLNVLMKKS